mmetsp:Transcript_32171/g.62932  ORF Transcript_32171/g.62932 Transcript_32171/m.62932 type:complete len:143 (-) Transcript_32171:1100-1528(-)
MLPETALKQGTVLAFHEQWARANDYEQPTGSALLGETWWSPDSTRRPKGGKLVTEVEKLLRHARGEAARVEANPKEMKMLDFVHDRTIGDHRSHQTRVVLYENLLKLLNLHNKKSKESFVTHERVGRRVRGTGYEPAFHTNE